MNTMKLPRRNFLQLAAGAAALPVLPRVARAQAYPSRPVRWIVAFAAGGPTDIVARIMGQYLSERLGQQFIIDNRPGAGGIVGTQAAINSPADGYTILMAAHVHAINATLYQRLPYNFVNDIAPIAGLVRMPNVMEVTPSFPARTVGEFIAYVTANPGKVSYASAGNGTSAHLAAELFRAMTGVDFVHVPYRGSGPALTDLLNGQVQVMFDTISSSIAHIQAGKLRALAVTSLTRSELLPDVPTIAETVPGYELSAWFGAGTPTGTPSEIIQKLNQEINAGLAEARIKARFAELGAEPMPMTVAEFRKFVADETERWAKVVKFSGAKAD
jgi:tripartite-type tricarboxylate transporter receptor subunit TctC